MPPNTTRHSSSEEDALLRRNNENDTSDSASASAKLSNLFLKPSLPVSSKILNRSYQPTTHATATDGDANGDDVPSGIFHKHDTCRTESSTSTAIGSFTFLLYHVVYCLAQASTITRPHAGHSSVGVMAKMAAIGTLFAGPVMVFELGVDVPAIYPASDLFLSPFLAQVAADVDQSLYEHGLENDDRAFLATFGALIGTGFLASGLLCIMAARIKLANLGAFLPYCVLCGFFTTIGILIWSLGFSVDTGMKVGELFHAHHSMEESWKAVWGRALLHHAPSFAVGVVMHIVGRRNSLYVIALILATLFASYAILYFTGTSLERAQELNWFFSSKELQDPPFLSSADESWWDSWTAPAPMGVWVMMLRGAVHWPSFRRGTSSMSALAFLYLIRCSLHAAALKKNIPNVTRKTPEPSSPSIYASINQSTGYSSRGGGHARRHIREPLSLGKILECGYGYSQLLAALSGGIAVAPAVAASLTLFKLGCEGVGSQYGSIFLVLIFYLTDFQLVQFIPKPAVSCLMVLAGLDMCKTWLVSSFFKTQAKLEWLVAPLIVVLALTVGMLNAIFLGVAISTFIFVANVYKAGTVKFIGNGLSLRSTVERGVPEAAWLNQNGDLIQILVLQNYLFFGNAQSVLHYVSTMFEEQDVEDLALVAAGQLLPFPPVPKYICIDFTIISGIDTSAVDILREICQICRGHQCKLFVSGLSPSLRSMLVYAKLSPQQEKGTLFFAPDLESALAKAEDGLIARVSHLIEKDESEHQALQDLADADENGGFLRALQKIDKQHGLNTVHELAELSRYLTPMDLTANEILPWENKTHHGLYFIEHGHLRIEHGADYTTNHTFQTRQSPSANVTKPLVSNTTIGRLNVGRQTTLLKSAKASGEMTEQSFRLARIGPGWVVGMIEECSGLRRSGVYVSVTPCRLHHLHYESMKVIEKSNPRLMMNLYKLMSNVSLKRQEMTIAQLAQFVSIMSSPASPSEPTSRSVSAALIARPWP